MLRYTLCSIFVLATVFVMATQPTSPAAAADVAGDEEIDLDVRLTHGPMGGRRPAKFIAGETIFATFRMRNIALNAENKLDLSISFDMRDADDYIVYKFDPKRASYKLPLGGNQITQSFNLKTPQDFQPGKFRVRLKIEDHVRNKTITRDIPFELLPSTQFGLLNLRMFHDREGNVPATNGFGVGAFVHVLGAIRGHQLKNQKTDVAVRSVFLDEQGNAVGEPIELLAAKVAPKYVQNASINLHMKYQLHMPGRYLLKIYIEDRVSGNEAEYEMSVIVTDSFTFDDDRVAKATNQEK